MPGLPKPTPRPWWSYLRLNLSRLIVLVLVIGAGLSWVVRGARLQRDAVAALRRTGGQVKYDWQWANRSPIPNGRPWAPKWLVERIGPDYFDHVVLVDLAGQGSDAEMAPIGDLGGLEELYLSGPSLTDAGLEPLERLAGLEVLSIYQTEVTDAGLVHLGRLTGLQWLLLRNTKVTSAGLAHLKGLTGLLGLILGQTRVGDEGLAHLSGLTNLRQLVLDHTEVTDAGLVHLEGLSSLQDLRIQGTRVTDAGARALEQALPGLRITR